MEKGAERKACIVIVDERWAVMVDGWSHLINSVSFS